VIDRVRQVYDPSMPLCLFCPEAANSLEHLWPKWVHERRDFGPLKHKRGTTDIIIPNPQITVKAVCRPCNNGWMSKLELISIPLIGSMMQNVSIQLDRGQQTTVAAWLMKMAFPTDWTRIGGRTKRFYSRDECAAFAHDLTISDRTRIWIGHITSSHLSTDGNDLARLARANATRLGTSTAVTLAVGHLAAQVVTDHLLPEFAKEDAPDSQPKSSPWANKLVQIWPIEKDWVMWPPKASFTNGGPEGYGYLMNRWRVGQQVDQVS
jgi:hypothetical protein